MRGYSLDDVRRRVIDLLKDVETGLSGIEIAERTGMNRITVTKYLSVLEAMGLIKRKQIGSVNIWYMEQGLGDAVSSTDMLDIRRHYMDAIFNFADSDARAIILNSIHSNLDPVRIMADILIPTINTATELYSRGKITVTEVALFTNLVTESLDLIKFNAERDGLKNNAHAIFMSAQGETRVIEPKMASIAFYLKGWDSYFLGNVASEADLLFDIDLMKFINKIWKPRELLVIGISAILKEHMKSIEETIKTLRTKIGKNLYVLVSGIVINENDKDDEESINFYAKDIYSALDWAEDIYKRFHIV